MIRGIQERLTALGHDTKGLDGIYGQDTEKALRAFQEKQRMEASGQVDAEPRKALLRPGLPGLFEWCLQITADFDGHGFLKAAGDFDGAGLTWGIIGFNFRSGTLTQVLQEIDRRSSALIDQTFGDLAMELRSVLERSVPNQIVWGRGISEGADRRRIRREWAAAFQRLGERPEVKEIQLAHVAPY